MFKIKKKIGIVIKKTLQTSIPKILPCKKIRAFSEIHVSTQLGESGKLVIIASSRNNRPDLTLLIHHDVQTMYECTTATHQKVGYNTQMNVKLIEN